MLPAIRLRPSFQLCEHLDLAGAPRDTAILCRDGTVTANSLLLAAVSPLVRQLLKARGELEEQAHISCPGLQASHLNVFLSDLYSRGKDITISHELRDNLFPKIDLENGFKNMAKDEVPYVLSSSHQPKVEMKIKEEEEQEDSASEKDYGDYWENNGHDDDMEEPETPPEKIECDICGEFKTVSYMPKHKRKMHGIKDLSESVDLDENEKYRCLKCDKSFPNKNIFKQHTIEFHTNHVCDLCDSKYASGSALGKHRREKHGDIFDTKTEGIKNEDNFHDNGESIKNKPSKGKQRKEKGAKAETAPVTCEICGKVWKSRHDLKSHMKMHIADKNFVCMECGKRFKREESLKYHTMRHKGIMDHHCEECGEAFVSTAALTTHKRNHHFEEGIFLCPECGTDCKNKYRLKRHMTAHTGERNFPCRYEGCDKRFALSQVREVHERLHRGVKEFHCTMCPKQFMQAQHLTVHLKRHNGIKDHTCITCGKAFVEPAGARNCRHGGKP